MPIALATLLLLLTSLSPLAHALTFELPHPGISAPTLAVIVNDSDPLSRDIADYYREQHNIPVENMVHVAFEPGRAVMRVKEFAALKTHIDENTPATVQAYLLTWAAPYRVGCMSMSAAMTFGFDNKYCADGCSRTAQSPYANAASSQPYTDFGIRPTMLLAATDIDQARALIDRGIAAQSTGTVPDGAAYLVETSDSNRSVRRLFFPYAVRQFKDWLPIHAIKSEGISNKSDVMFYFTGQKDVDDLRTNKYLPGAMADHLTSMGGQLIGNDRQMSAMRWLEAGVTGSYGAVVEPCNYLEKFPNPIVAIGRYLQGESLLEAYWKSVDMPGQGVFIGDPLARPYPRFRLSKDNGGLVLQVFLDTGTYQLLSAAAPGGPYELIKKEELSKPGALLFSLQPPYHRVYRVEPIDNNRR